MAENATQEPIQRIHYYHADANAVGGFINRPFTGFVPSHTSVSLPVVGGFLKKERGGRKWKNTVTYTSESTHVSGAKRDEGEGGPWTTQVSATIEGLNILEVITADKVVAQLSVEHPAEGYDPKVYVTGSQFINLRISGILVNPVINYNLFEIHDGGSGYPKRPWPQQESLQKIVKEQYQNAGGSSRVPDWLRHHFNWIDSGQSSDTKNSIVCSLVDSIEGIPANFPGTAFGHGIHVKDFGRIYFGELIISHGTYTLSMIRAQLGSPVGGAISAATARSNGNTEP